MNIKPLLTALFCTILTLSPVFGGERYEKRPLYGQSFVYSGDAAFYLRALDLLQEVESYEVGREMIAAIESHDNQVEIIHAPFYRSSAGVTGAPMTQNLTNGVGEDVYIKMDFTIPDHGSHVVYNANGKEIEFTALQNFFHELSHARHKSGGTWRYFDSEGQAIEDENELRREQASRAGVEPLLRSGMDGELRFP